ncbi:hypothetical protein H5410_042356 [Solanum commersonii]|uniref:phosphopyruvate hydratase n=1 Tax=Solanum commersonii TaxID=4109 RepID=A0A9J5XVT1_SOLCO|nr:hypothetical protein H5410_042356 [Solanum commersonii]
MEVQEERKIEFIEQYQNKVFVSFSMKSEQAQLPLPSILFQREKFCSERGDFGARVTDFVAAKAVDVNAKETSPCLSLMQGLVVTLLQKQPNDGTHVFDTQSLCELYKEFNDFAIVSSEDPLDQDDRSSWAELRSSVDI